MSYPLELAASANKLYELVVLKKLRKPIQCSNLYKDSLDIAILALTSPRSSIARQKARNVIYFVALHNTSFKYNSMFKPALNQVCPMRDLATALAWIYASLNNLSSQEEQKLFKELNMELLLIFNWARQTDNFNKFEASQLGRNLQATFKDNVYKSPSAKTYSAPCQGKLLLDE